VPCLAAWQADGEEHERPEHGLAAMLVFNLQRFTREARAALAQAQAAGEGGAVGGGGAGGRPARL
jgi:hypothetical protein